jgi:hypothetical protein
MLKLRTMVAEADKLQDRGLNHRPARYSSRSKRPANDAWGGFFASIDEFHSSSTYCGARWAS